MELRVLKYFLTVAREQSISAAAEALHLSQPTLSRQLKELEDQLGKPLLIRGPRRVTLTEEGMLLRKRAEEILSLVQKATDEVTFSDQTVIGNIHIGTGETEGVRYLAKASKQVQLEHPGICIHIITGDTIDIQEYLDRGILDFALQFGPVDAATYDSLQLPCTDSFGLLMRKDSPLAAKEVITMEDLWNIPLIVNRNAFPKDSSAMLFGRKASDLNIVATYTLLYNGSLMVDEGMGYALCLDGIINTSGDSNLCYRPLYPEVSVGMSIVWKRNQRMSKPAEKFRQKLQELYG